MFHLLVVFNTKPFGYISNNITPFGFTSSPNKKGGSTFCKDTLNKWIIGYKGAPEQFQRSILIRE